MMPLNKKPGKYSSWGAFSSLSWGRPFNKEERKRNGHCASNSMAPAITFYFYLLVEATVSAAPRRTEVSA
jgi:hypothetical protein